MKVFAVMPCVDLEWAQPAIDRCRFDEVGHLAVIDNSTKNRGIMRSHNMGIDAATREGADWFVIMSSSLILGKAGGLDWLERADASGCGVVSGAGTFGWHLVGFRRDVMLRMGRFDENFSPYGLDDIDLSIRIHKAMPDIPWMGAEVAIADDRMMAHSIKSGKINPPYKPIGDYFREKWLTDPGVEFEDYADHPFGFVALDINYWPPFEDGAWNQPSPEQL